MIRSRLIAPFFALLGSAVVAGGLDDVVESAPVQPAPMLAQPDAGWTGFYVGGQLLIGDGDVGATDYEVSSLGAHVGYLYGLGGFVVGGEVDYDSFNLDDGVTEIDGRAARLKAVAGYDLGSFMPYVAAGIADVEIEAIGGDLRDQIGFYGLGGNYQLNDRFRVGAEYLIHQGDNFDGSGLDVDIETLSVRGSFSF